MYIDPSQINDLHAASASGSVGSSFQRKRKVDQAAEPRLGREYASVLRRSLQQTVENPEAVRQAREAVLSGQIDQYESARQAAEKLLQYGF